MRQQTIIGLVILAVTIPASAGLRFGLGDAVAKRSAELINKAGGSTAIVGENVAGTLASCPSGAIFDSLPIDMNLVRGVDPLGHVQPTGHTFPSDHIYYYSSTSTVTPVYAPGNIHITAVATSSNLSAIPVHTDYTVTFYSCREYRSVYGHVKTLTPALLSQVGAMSRCDTYQTGGNTFQLCTADTNIEMHSGDLIGYTAISSALDFGSADSRVTLSYVSPNRRGPYQLHTVCPMDYFTPALKAQMEARTGLFDGAFQRVNPPICGTIAQDVANSAKGYWYHPGSPDNPEDPHLSLIDNNVFAPKQTISVGNSLPNGGGMWTIFDPVSGPGQFVDRQFSEVTSDGNIYCYDTFIDPLGNPAFTNYVFILQMPTATTLKFEKVTPAFNCAAVAPWTFGGNAVTYHR
jgi:hypothetical protein